MSPQLLNAIEAFLILFVGVALLATSLWRKYPIRSMFVYASIVSLGFVNIVGATGAWLRFTADIGPEAIANITLLVGVGRGFALVLLLALLWYEHSYNNYRR